MSEQEKETFDERATASADWVASQLVDAYN